MEGLFTGSFAGPDKLFRFVRKAGKYVISKYNIRKWLQNQETVFKETKLWCLASMINGLLI